MGTLFGVASIESAIQIVESAVQISQTQLAAEKSAAAERAAQIANDLIDEKKRFSISRRFAAYIASVDYATVDPLKDYPYGEPSVGEYAVVDSMRTLTACLSGLTLERSGLALD